MVAHADLKRKASQITEDPAANANNVPKLLLSLTSAADEETLKVTIRALKVFFSSAGDFGKSKSRRVGEADNDRAVTQWLDRQFDTYTASLLQLLRGKSTASVQVAAVGALMDAVRTQHTGHFSTASYRRLFHTLVTCPNVHPEVLALLLTKYVPLVDVRYYTLRSISSIAAAQRAGPGSVGHGDEGPSDDEAAQEAVQTADGGSLPDADVARNLYDVLCAVASTTPDSTAEMSSWCGAVEVGIVTAAPDAKESSKARKRRRQQETGAEPSSSAIEAVAWANPKAQKRAFSEAWVALLRLRLPDDVLRKALARLGDVLPHMTSPLLLADMLTGALDRGGLSGMLALNGLFLLVTQYGLEYPAFYQRLYNLLTPASLLSKQRSRFFQLADIFLSSGLVPAYTAAAFAKKFARLALMAPPAGAMLALAFIHNLLRRHPSCTVLLHRTVADNQAAAGVGEDVYDEAEEDPAKSRAVESSLWELSALRAHYFPQVAAFVSILDKDVGDRKRTAEVDLEPLLQASASTLITDELNKKIKGAATEFFQTPPVQVLPLAELPAFAGWRALAASS